MNRKQRRAAAKLGQTSGHPPGGAIVPSASSGAADLLAAGLKLHQAGRLAEAEVWYRRVLAAEPNHADALNLLGVVAHQVGRHDLAVELIGQAIKQNRQNPGYFSNLGNAFYGQGKLNEAVAAYREALSIKPDSAEVHSNLGVALLKQGNVSGAVAALRQAISVKPDYADAHLNLGNALQEQGMLDEAVAEYRRTINIIPEHDKAHFNLGNALQEQGMLDEAVAEYRLAISIRPGSAEIHSNLGNALQEQGKLDDAIAEYRQAISIRPDYALTHSNLGNALQKQGKLDEAVVAYRQAISIQPDYAGAYYNLGTALRGKLDDAVAAYRQAISIKPDHADAHYNLGVALQKQGKLDEAVAVCRRAISIKPDYAEAHLNLGNALQEQGKLDEALASYDRALAIKPDLAVASSNKIFTYDLVPELGFAEHQDLRRTWYQTHAKDLLSTSISHPNTPDPLRRLVVGYVSADFRHHSAALAFGAVLRRHDRASFQVVCYSDVTVEDALTQEFRRLAEVWRPIKGLSDEAVVAQIRADKVDVLVDLSGHSAGNRLLIFARKPAPVQVTAWGHATGTGIPAIDYLFSDRVAVPEAARPLFAEKIYDLPCLIPYEASSYAPPVSELPALSRGFVTFGCLNRFSKVSPTVMELWARILQMVPTSRLLLKDKSLDDPSQQALVRDTLASHGVDSSRIELRAGSSHKEHLAAYGEVDIALDPFPQNGGVTTWEALWMGVPVVAKLGNSLPSRLSGAILSNVGLADWIAGDNDEYAALAVKKAADLEALARLRKELRPAISGSRAGNPVLYTLDVEKAYKNIWSQWCASKLASPNASDHS